MYTHFSATWVRPTGVLTASGLEMTFDYIPILGTEEAAVLDELRDINYCT